MFHSRWLSRFLWALVLAAPSVVGTAWWERHTADAELAEEVAGLDWRDPGWTYEAIETTFARVPAERNAARVVVEAADLMPPDWPQLDCSIPPQPGGPAAPDLRRLDKYDPREPLPATVPESVAKFLEQAKAALERLPELDACSEGSFDFSYDVNMMNSLLTVPYKARPVSQLLWHQGLLAAHLGQPREASRAVARMFGVARCFDRRSCIQLELVRTAIVVNSMTPLEHILAHGILPAKDLERLQTRMEQEDQEVAESYLQAARLERALLHRMFSALDDGRLTLPDVGIGSASWQDALFTFPTGTEVRRQHAQLLRLTTTAVDAYRQPWSRTNAGLTRPKDGIAAVMMGSLEFTQDFVPRVQTRVRVAAAALAAERYRLDHHAWPEALSQLVPDYLAAVPADPFGDGPLKLVHRDDGILIYSVGPDGVDNAGARDFGNAARAGCDSGFALVDAHRRRADAE